MQRRIYPIAHRPTWSRNEFYKTYLNDYLEFIKGNELNEPLTGRKWEYELFPISWEEYENKIGYIKAEQQVENRLLYGFYPEVINNQGKERETLKNLVNSYLDRDILAFSDIRKPEILDQLLQALALQMGSEVNYHVYFKQLSFLPLL